MKHIASIMALAAAMLITQPALAGRSCEQKKPGV